jgi:hypothetical protein
LRNSVFTMSIEKFKKNHNPCPWLIINLSLVKVKHRYHFRTICGATDCEVEHKPIKVIELPIFDKILITSMCTTIKKISKNNHLSL